MAPWQAEWQSAWTRPAWGDDDYNHGASQSWDEADEAGRNWSTWDSGAASSSWLDNVGNLAEPVQGYQQGTTVSEEQQDPDYGVGARVAADAGDKGSTFAWSNCVAHQDASFEEHVESAGEDDEYGELQALHSAAITSYLQGDQHEHEATNSPMSDHSGVPPGESVLDVVSNPEPAVLGPIFIHGDGPPESAVYDPTTGGVDCHLCMMHLNSLKQWEDHRTGKKHVKKLNNPKRWPALVNGQAAASGANPDCATPAENP